MSCINDCQDDRIVYGLEYHLVVVNGLTRAWSGCENNSEVVQDKGIKHGQVYEKENALVN